MGEDEDTRAAAWRLQARRRQAARRASEAALRGNPSAFTRLAEDWKAVTSWPAERRQR